MKGVKLGLCFFSAAKRHKKRKKMIQISIAELLPLATNAYCPMTNALVLPEGLEGQEELIEEPTLTSARCGFATHLIGRIPVISPHWMDRECPSSVPGTPSTSLARRQPPSPRRSRTSLPAYYWLPPTQPPHRVRRSPYTRRNLGLL